MNTSKYESVCLFYTNNLDDTRTMVSVDERIINFFKFLEEDTLREDSQNIKVWMSAEDRNLNFTLSSFKKNNLCLSLRIIF